MVNGVSESQNGEGSVEQRLEELERRSELNRIELQRLRAQLGSPKTRKHHRNKTNDDGGETPRPPSVWSLVLDVSLWLIGSAAVFAFIIGEMHWHWAIAAVIAPFGGFVVLMLGRSGVTV